jgi:heparosan-N-sulfate-glucuronate 5-epimerase
MSRLNYYRRIFAAYLGNSNSQLSFWHEVPEVNENARSDELGEYYMTFAQKADYAGAFDKQGIPLLDYRGALGLQYNPIAIAQYGLGNHNLYLRSADLARKAKVLRVADWLVSSMRRNHAGLWMWMHDFDWEYRDTLRAPWYSGLAQGQGISLLLRAYKDNGKAEYLDSAHRAFESFKVDVKSGGVICTDENGDRWFEEYVVFPETHILNGFIWASWGVYDYYLATRDEGAANLFQSAVETLRRELKSYDIGFWSLYERSGTRLPMVASPFYHSLHIVQLRVMQKITGEKFFGEFARRWETYRANRVNRSIAVACKAAFKLLYY